jgi:hypothetical protein
MWSEWDDVVEAIKQIQEEQECIDLMRGVEKPQPPPPQYYPPWQPDWKPDMDPEITNYPRTYDSVTAQEAVAMRGLTYGYVYNNTCS